MASVLTITTNPAVDMATSVAAVVAGPKLRCGSPRWDPGGGGVNVARAVTRLGGEATALVAVGGALGDRLVALLAAEGVTCLPVAVSGETRISFAVTDDSNGAQFRFSVPGEPLSDAEGAALLSQVAAVAPKHDLAVFSGSVAPGLPSDFVARIQDVLAPGGTRLIVDTSAAALGQLLTQPRGLFALRLDQTEAELATGTKLGTVEDSRALAASLVARGVAEIVVMGRGADGSVIVSRDGQFHCAPPKVTVRSKIGAGDTFVGAFALSLARGEAPEVALRHGVAGAAATVETEGTALCTRDEAEALFARSTCRRIGD